MFFCFLIHCFHHLDIRYIYKAVKICHHESYYVHIKYQFLDSETVFCFVYLFGVKQINWKLILVPSLWILEWYLIINDIIHNHAVVFFFAKLSSDVLALCSLFTWYYFCFSCCCAVSFSHYIKQTHNFFQFWLWSLEVQINCSQSSSLGKLLMGILPAVCVNKLEILFRIFFL